MKVLVTGAGGFIGGRIVEVLHLGGLAEPRAGVRRWASAARIGRLPVEIVPCDIMNRAQLDAARDGVDAVVHCATGSREVIVRGTANVLAAALEGGAQRVVHLSTCDVYGKARGEIDEAHPLVRTDRVYGNAKIEAEELCREFGKAGLPVVVLRPTIVYGPFSGNWTVEFAERLREGHWPVPRAYGAGTCNLVYVDDLVQAVVRALSCEAAVGEAFNIDGAEDLTWNDYWHALHEELQSPAASGTPSEPSRAATALMAPVRSVAKMALKRFEGPVTRLYRGSGTVRRIMKWAEHRIRMTPTPAEFDLYSREVSFSIEKARRLMGYAPSVSSRDGIRLSADWLRHHGYVR